MIVWALAEYLSDNYQQTIDDEAVWSILATHVYCVGMTPELTLADMWGRIDLNAGTEIMVDIEKPFESSPAQTRNMTARLLYMKWDRGEEFNILYPMYVRER